MDNQSAAGLDEDSEAKVLQAVLPAILPSILQYRTKAFQAGGASNGQDPVQDEKFWGPVIAAAITAAPDVYRSLRRRRKDFEPEPDDKAVQGPAADDKIWPMAIAAAISAAPSIYRAVRGKDFEAAPGANPQAASPQAPVNGGPRGVAAGELGHAPQGVDEKTWGQVVAAAITAAPNIYRAVRGKDFEVAPGASPQVASPQAPISGGPRGIAVGEPGPAPQGVDDKTWGQVIAAAITAAPNIYRAVRGKDFQLT